jgi:hypothetical protein
MKLTRVEWRVAAVVMAKQPVTAWDVARILGLEYTHVKRAVRELARWNVLTPSPEGLWFQPARDRWDRSTVPSDVPAGRPRLTRRPEDPGAKDTDEVVLTL